MPLCFRRGCCFAFADSICISDLLIACCPVLACIALCFCYSGRVCARVRAARQKTRSLASYEHLLSGRYISTHRASRSISAQAVAPSVMFSSAQQRSWVARVRSSGPAHDGDTKILNAPTYKANHMIMMIPCVVCTNSKASRNCFR